MKINKVKKVKTVAFERLSPCWGECAGIFFVTLGVLTVFLAAAALVTEILFSAGIISRGIPEILTERTTGFYICAGICSAVLYLLLSPLKYGVCWFCSQALRGQNVPASCLFSCYMHRSHFFGTIKLSLMTLLLRTAGALPLCAAGAAEYYFLNRIVTADESPLEVFAAAVLIPAVATAAAHFIWVLAKYMFVPFIYISDPDADVKKILSESGRIIKGNVAYILRTVLSFALWLVLGAVLIFPAVYSLPYFLMTVAALYKDITSRGGRGTAEKKEEGSTVVS